MNWFFFLLLFLVFAMIVGPILLIKPSPRQQRIAQLRTKAGSLGLRVSLQNHAGQSIAVYEKPWPRNEQQRYGGQEWSLERQSYQHEIHFNEWWAWKGNKPRADAVLAILQEKLTELPKGVMAIEANGLGLRCYWSEQGTEETLKQLAGWLTDTSDAIWPYVRRPEASPTPDLLDSDY